MTIIGNSNVLTGGQMSPSNTSTATGTGTGTAFPFYYTYTGNYKIRQYYTFLLPENKIPHKIYIGGLLVTFGMFGSAAEVSFCKPNYLIITGQSITSGKISIEYSKKIYHYSFDINGGAECEEGSCIIKATLLSTISK